MTYDPALPRPAYLPMPRPTHYAVSLRLAPEAEDCLIPNVTLLRLCVALAMQRTRFDLIAAVVLPRELHMLCEVADRSLGMDRAIRMICSTFEEHANMDGPIWQAQEDPLEISPAVLALRARFIEAAPVRAGLVGRAEDWPHSSVHKRGELGIAVA
ncbi:MAG: hypothetical protein AAGL89_08645 [Pseudomonadota bacterium]